MARRVPLSVYDRLSCGSFVSRPLIHGYRRGAVPVNRPTESQPGHVDDAIDLSTDLQSYRSKINLHPLLRLALLRNHGISQLNSIQESAYMTILSGKDVTLHAPIGSGKTLAYLLPIVNNIYNIHDLLEDLQLRNGGTGVEDDRIRMNALGYSRKVPHAMLTRSIRDVYNDPKELQASATQALESNSTTEKLVDTLYKVDPRQIRRHAKWLPIISRKLWGRRSRNSIFRALMANPLGSVRCCVIVVPNKDLVAQVISELRTIDPLGRLSIQTLTQLHSVPVKDSHKPVDYPNEVVTQPLFPSMHTLHYLQEGPTKIQLSHEDEQKMLENVPTVNIAETTLQMIPINRARVHSRTVKVRSNDCVSHGRLSAGKPGIEITGPHCPNGLITADGLASYGVDGLVPRSVEYAKRPIMIHPVIQ
uniref:ATP-dependent RNA helicase n=2 Tax=Babesia bovis TaxID=5865 RepID=A7AP28_BABBO|eukprot:XP_001611880.1 hypothetical protein [Babesia bovis T2Bo]